MDIETRLNVRLFAPMPWRKTDGPAQLNNLLYFGGPESVRGYPYASREGDGCYLLSPEYPMPWS